MELKRVVEITDSLGVIDVTYKKHSVWIESLNKVEETAMVLDLQTHNVLQVPIAELKE